MTTSSFTVIDELPNFEKGRMYQAKADDGEDLIVLCTFNLRSSPFFEGVVIHQGKSSHLIGMFLNGCVKRSFVEFHGEVVLKS